jgi:hypothetical protein
MTRWQAAVVVGVLLPLAGSARAQVTAQNPVAVPPLTLPDQFGQDHSVADLRGRVVVLIYGDRKSADSNRALGEWLHVFFHPTAAGQPPAMARLAPVKPIEGQAPGVSGPEVVAVPVAAVGKVPGLVAGIIRRQMRCGSPEVPIWLDFRDDMADLFGLKPGVPGPAALHGDRPLDAEPTDTVGHGHRGTAPRRSRASGAALAPRGRPGEGALPPRETTDHVIGMSKARRSCPGPLARRTRGSVKRRVPRRWASSAGSMSA